MTTFTGQKDYQTMIALNTLYAISYTGNGTEQVQPSIEIVGAGTVDIYGSNEKVGSAPTGMFKTATAFTGIEAFGVVPNYLYIAQNSGTTTDIILSGIKATAV